MSHQFVPGAVPIFSASAQPVGQLAQPHHEYHRQKSLLHDLGPPIGAFSSGFGPLFSPGVQWSRPTLYEGKKLSTKHRVHNMC